MLQDKKSIIQVLGCLLKQPSLLSSAYDYSLNKDDFPEQFHKIIFAAIHNLYQNGTEEIDAVAIDGFLSNYDIQYKIFNDNDGVKYLYQIQELSNLDNFDYYYERLKKYSFLRSCKEKGINIDEIYNEDLVDPKEHEKMQEKFDSYTLNDLIAIVEKKIVGLKEEFKTNKNSSDIQGADGIEELIEDLKQNPDFGAPLCSKYLNTICRGARKKKFYLRSSISGGGKTRLALADLLNIVVDEIYDTEKQKWVFNGDKQKGLFITTELSFDEIQVPAISFISAVPENKILRNSLSEDEAERVKKAIEILKRSDFWIAHLPDFDVNDIEQVIEKHILNNGVEYVVFDYIHSSMKLLSSITTKSKVNMREDQILLLLSDKLKTICNKYDVWLLSGTQLNGEWKNSNNQDASSIRGSKAIIDKTDFAIISLPVTRQDLDSLEPILRNGYYPKPNLVFNVFKNRRGEYNNVKIWVNVDLGTLRTKDCFVTNDSYEILNIQPTEIKVKKFDF